ncbi:hypothetical protein [Deinococcus navajonensis]|uniref:Uncharacterized protein n=1 Tax=Deinococcus navajonensis TaxID=309884 RepID=A0ABV8XM57_9DEIO
MKRSTMSNLPLIALASLPLTVGLVFAQSTTAPQRVQPAQPGTAQGAPNTQAAPSAPGPDQAQSGTHYANVFVQNLAAGLGITVERLRSAAVAAGGATLDQAVKAGDLTSDRAAEVKGRLATAPFTLGDGRFGGRHGGRGGFGLDRDRGGGAGPAVAAAVAKALGLSEQALRDQLRAGQTVAQLAQRRSLSAAALRAAALRAFQQALAAEVKAGRLTQAHAEQRMAQAQADANFGLNLGGHRPEMGGRGSFGGRGGWDGQASPQDPAAAGDPRSALRGDTSQS